MIITTPPQSIHDYCNTSSRQGDVDFINYYYYGLINILYLR